MATRSHLDELGVEELISLIFLADQDKSPDELERLVTDSDFIELWREDRKRLKKLVENYPEIEEEKHFLMAMLEAAYGYHPFSEETEMLRDSLMPFVSVLVRNI